MNPLPVSAKSLHGRVVRVGNETFGGVSLLPFFNRDGRVKHVMMIRPESSEIYLLPWRRGDFVVPIWSAVRLTGEATWLQPLTEDRLGVGLARATEMEEKYHATRAELGKVHESKMWKLWMTYLQIRGWLLRPFRRSS